MDQHYQVDLIMLDFFKAFDTVAHNKLLLKLEHYGIQLNTHLWLQTWLTKRIQKVVVEGETSKNLKVLYIRSSTRNSFRSIDVSIVH